MYRSSRVAATSVGTLRTSVGPALREPLSGLRGCSRWRSASCWGPTRLSCRQNELASRFEAAGRRGVVPGCPTAKYEQSRRAVRRLASPCPCDVTPIARTREAIGRRPRACAACWQIWSRTAAILQLLSRLGGRVPSKLRLRVPPDEGEARRGGRGRARGERVRPRARRAHAAGCDRAKQPWHKGAAAARARPTRLDVVSRLNDRWRGGAAHLAPRACACGRVNRACCRRPGGAAATRGAHGPGVSHGRIVGM